MLDAVVTVPSVRFAPVIALWPPFASSRRRSAPATCGGPLDTTRFTALPCVACAPAVGV
jgi:hypothetical protein